MKVLVVDDEKDMTDCLEHLLKPLGYEVFKAYDAYGAINEFRARHPDIILLDFAMPAGSGADVYAKVRAMEAGRELPIVFVSATPKYQLSQLLPEDPKIRFVEKPIDINDLEMHMNDLLGTKSSPKKEAEDEGFSGIS